MSPVSVGWAAPTCQRTLIAVRRGDEKVRPDQAAWCSWWRTGPGRRTVTWNSLRPIERSATALATGQSRPAEVQERDNRAGREPNNQRSRRPRESRIGRTQLTTTAMTASPQGHLREGKPGPPRRGTTPRPTQRASEHRPHTSRRPHGPARTVKSGLLRRRDQL